MTLIATSQQSYCRHCTRTVPAAELRLAPLGRDDAMVPICRACDEDVPTANSGPDRSYEPSGGLPTSAESLAGARRACGDAYARLAQLDEQESRTPSKALDDTTLAELDRVREFARRARQGRPMTVNRQRSELANEVNRRARR